MNDINPSTSKQETSMDLDMAHEVLNQGIVSFYRYLGLPGPPSSVEKEALGWFLSSCTPSEITHLVALIASDGARAACVRYALDRANGDEFQSTERAIFDVLLDALQERGHEPVEISRMLEAIIKPFDHLLDMFSVSAAPCPRCVTARLHTMHGDTADHTDECLS